MGMIWRKKLEGLETPKTDAVKTVVPPTSMPDTRRITDFQLVHHRDHACNENVKNNHGASDGRRGVDRTMVRYVSVNICLGGCGCRQQGEPRQAGRSSEGPLLSPVEITSLI